MDEYRSQIKNIKNKIDRDYYTIENIKQLIIDKIKKSDITISDNLLNYIFKYIEKYKFNFCDCKVDLRSKNYLQLKLSIKNKSKILNIGLGFTSYSKEYYCSSSYFIIFINEDREEYFNNEYDKAYKKFISN